MHYMHSTKYGIVNKSESYIFAIERNAIPNILNPYREERVRICNNQQIPIIPTIEKPIMLHQIGHYHNDPSWIRIRWLFYTAFWFGWIFSLFCGIILTASQPKCVLSVREWWKDSIIYEIWTLSYQDSDGDGTGDLNGITEKIDHLWKIGITSIFLRPIIKVESYGLGVINYTDLSTQIGSFDDFSSLIRNAHDKGIRVLIDLPLVITSIAHPWYEKSALASQPENSQYADFYFWRRNIPNSEYITSYKNSTLNYFHVKSRPKLPVLSWSNVNVSHSIMSALSFWIQNGIDGFHLTAIEYLHRSSDGKEADWKEITRILHSIQKYVLEKKTAYFGDKIFLFTSCEHLSEKTKLLLVEEGGIDAIVNTELRKLEMGNKVCSKTTLSIAECTNEILCDLLLFHENHERSVWPIWSYGNAFTSRLVSRVKSIAVSELLMLLELILPGTPMIYYGEEVGQGNCYECKYPQRAPFSMISNGSDLDFRTQQDSFDLLRNVKRIIRFRRISKTLAIGKVYITKSMGQSFALCRYLIKENNDGTSKIHGDVLVYAANFGSEDQILSLNDLPPFHIQGMIGKGKIITRGINSKDFHISSEIDLSSREIRLRPIQGIVIQAFAGY